MVAGLAFQADLITREAEAALIARIDAVDLTPFRFQGWLGKRVTASFGWRYDSTMPASARPNPSPTGFCPSATARPPLLASTPPISSRSC